MSSSTSRAVSRRTRPYRTANKRKRMIIILIVVIAAVDIILATFFFMNSNFTGRAAVDPDQRHLISGQLGNNHGKVIADIGYDPALTLDAIAPYITSVNTNDLKPLSNNYLTRVSVGDERTVVLIDETAVGRIIAFNADFVNYLNGDDQNIFADVLKGSKAEEFVASHKGCRIAYHRFAFGSIYTWGARIYVIVQPQYTLLKDGQSATVNDVFLIKLVKQGETLVVSDIEDIKIPNGTLGQR